MKIQHIALAGVAVAALAVIGTAFAAGPKPQVHEMTVALPGGGVEHIRYTGNVAPVVVADPFAPTVAAFDPFAMDPVFARLDRISARMNAFWANFDRQMAQQIANDPAIAAMNDPNFPMNVSMGKLPNGMSGYSYISTFSSNGACTRMVRITSDGSDAKPQVVSQTSGDCNGKGMNGQTATPATGEHDNASPDVINAHYTAPHAATPRQSL